MVTNAGFLADWIEMLKLNGPYTVGNSYTALAPPKEPQARQVQKKGPFQDGLFLPYLQLQIRT